MRTSGPIVQARRGSPEPRPEAFGATATRPPTSQRPRLWHVPDGRVTAELAGHTDTVNNCAFSPDGTLLATVSDDRTARLWRVATGAEDAVLAHPGWVEGCAFSPDGTLLATASHDQTIRIWTVASRDATARSASPALSSKSPGIPMAR
jgi:WD40 repeat protein